MTTDTEIVDAMARAMEKVSLPGHNFNSKIFAANALAVAKPMIERKMLRDAMAMSFGHQPGFDDESAEIVGRKMYELAKSRGIDLEAEDYE